MDLKVSLTYDRDATTTLDFLVAPGSTLKELAIFLDYPGKEDGEGVSGRAGRL